jgi:hypothetical protein
MTEKSYSASLTGEPLQFFESKVVAGLMLNGLSYSEIKQKVYDENLFNYKTKKSIYKRVASVYRRLKNLETDLLGVIAEGGEDSRMMVLFSIMLSNRLFFDFMTEVIRKKFFELDYTLEKRDVMKFFDIKREESENVSSWKEYTFHKLRQVMLNILKEAYLLSGDDPYSLRKVIVSKSFRDKLVIHHLDYLLDCIGG